MITIPTIIAEMANCFAIRAFTLAPSMSPLSLADLAHRLYTKAGTPMKRQKNSETMLIIWRK